MILIVLSSHQTNELEIIKTAGVGLRALSYSAHPMVFPTMPSNQALMSNTTPGFTWTGGDSMLGHYILRINKAAEVIYIAEGSQNPSFENSGSLLFGNETSEKNAAWGNKTEVQLNALIQKQVLKMMMLKVGYTFS